MESHDPRNREGSFLFVQGVFLCLCVYVWACLLMPAQWRFFFFPGPQDLELDISSMRVKYHRGFVVHKSHD